MTAFLMIENSGMGAARAFFRGRDRSTIAEQMHIAAIPAPTGDEAARGAYLTRRFEEVGLTGVTTDAVGNVIGRLPGLREGEAPVVVAAHLDSVFPAGTDVRPRTEGKRIHGPGITDNARGVAAVIMVAAAMKELKLRTRRPVVFVGTVGEEGTGDLRGVKHLLRDGSELRGAAAFIGVDGPGTTRIVNRGIGSVRFRATVSGPGGHSWGDRGLPNPVDAIGEAIVRLGAVEQRAGDGAAVTVGRVGGGTSVNSIPAEAWLELDLRAEDATILASLEAQARDAMVSAAMGKRGGRRTGTARLTLSIERIGDRPCGGTAPADALVIAAAEATRAIGEQPELTAASTDANVPMSLGIPAITLGAGGRGGGIHTLDEWFENHDGASGIERVLLTIVGIAS